MDRGTNLGLGRFGIYTFDLERLSASDIRESVRALEAQGWEALWFPELGGREALSLAGFLLAETDRMSIVNAIARIGARSAAATVGGASLLSEAYADRHVLGLGYGAHTPGISALAAMRAYLDELDALSTKRAKPAPIRRILAAYGPKMAELARDRAAGVHTYHVTVEHTAQTRKILGHNGFLGVQHAVLLETNPASAKEIGRKYLRGYLKSPFSVANFRRLGYSQDEITGVSDRMVDDLVFWGDPASVARKLKGHLGAGADHVAIQVIGLERGISPVPHLDRLAEILRG